MGAGLKYDPVEDTIKYKMVIWIVELMLKIKFSSQNRRQLGFCYIYWETKKKYLKLFGIRWRSPAEMNPHVQFD